MKIKVTQFRQNLFQYLDQCLESGQPIIIERGKEAYRLAVEKKRLPISSLPQRSCQCADSNEMSKLSTYEWQVNDFS